MAVPMNAFYGGGITPVGSLLQPGRTGRIGFQSLEPRNRLQRRTGSSIPSIRDNLRPAAARGTQRPGELARLRATYAPESRAAFRAGSSRLLQSWMGRRVDLYA